MKCYKLYLLGTYNNTTVYTLLKTFETKAILLDFLSYHQHTNGKYYDSWLQKTIYNNIYLDKINLSGNDTYRLEEYGFIYCKTAHNLRRYMFLDKDDRIIDVRTWYPEIFEQAHGTNAYFSYQRLEDMRLKAKRRQHRHLHTTYAYRKLKWKHILEDRHDKEHAQYIRRKAANRLDNCSGFRSISGSWKDQSKRKHQWKEDKITA